MGEAQRKAARAIAMQQIVIPTGEGWTAETRYLADRIEKLLAGKPLGQGFAAALAALSSLAAFGSENVEFLDTLADETADFIKSNGREHWEASRAQRRNAGMPVDADSQEPPS